MVVMYIITMIVCVLQAGGIEVQSQEALDETLNVMKLIFTPINAMIVLSSLGNTFGKVKDKVIDTDKAGKRLIIILIIFVIVIAFEASYIKSFIQGLLG